MRPRIRRRLVPSVLAVVALAIVPLVPAAGADPAPVRRALLIGINDYLANDVRTQGATVVEWIPQDLRGARNDVDMIRTVLQSRFGFEAANVRELTDRDATREAILGAMTELVESAGPNDVVYLHFSGHGSQVKDVSGDETRDGMDETILSYDARTEDVRDITDDEIGAVLSRLRTRNALVVLDSCHSGTATRGGPAVATRSVPADPREALYRDAAAPRTRGTLPDASNYVVMTGAADFESALDGPLNGSYYGFFSWALASSLGRAEADATPGDIHAAVLAGFERIGAKFSQIRMPEPQLEAPPALLDRPVLRAVVDAPAGSGADPRLPFVLAAPAGPGRARLADGVLLGGLRGSSWALYPPGETAFEPDAALDTGVVDATDGDDALLALDRVEDATVPEGARAVLIAPPRADGRVSVRVDASSPERSATILAALRSALPAATPPGDDGFARFVVVESEGTLRLFGASGVQEIASVASDDLAVAARRIADQMTRGTTVAELLSLENLATAIDLRVRALPAGPDGATRSIRVVGAGEVPAYRARRPGEARTRANSLQLELASDTDVYVTVMHVDPAGEVAQLFPNPLSEKAGYFPGGRIAGGEVVLLPDTVQVENSEAGFAWDLSAPYGLDTVQVFATTDEATTDEIRRSLAALAGDPAPATRGRGEKATPGRAATLAALGRSLRGGATARGIRMVSAEDARAESAGAAAEEAAADDETPEATPPQAAPGAPTRDWATATVTFVVEEE